MFFFQHPGNTEFIINLGLLKKLLIFNNLVKYKPK